MKNGLLLINIGTPTHPTTLDVGRYLSEFLSDKRVITLPAFFRYLLLYGFILPFRVQRSTHAYQAIWTAKGSPLLVYSQKLVKKVQAELGTSYKVVLGMRYGHPSLEQAIQQLKNCETITVLPLYPQYSSAATGSSIEEALELLARQTVIPSIRIINHFYSHPAFIAAQAAIIKPYLSNHDHVLFSYHGIPESHLQQSGCKKICTHNCPVSANTNCYRAQCQQTTTLLAQALGLPEKNYSTAFQSRLGKTPWIKPYTDEILQQLIAQGVKRIAVACPSFVTDCLETIEEIGLRLKEQWEKLGGEHLTSIPCLNDNESWVHAITDITQR
jgi:protoporphyrin/coproporphyrin ferrochelatase